MPRDHYSLTSSLLWSFFLSVDPIHLSLSVTNLIAVCITIYCLFRSVYLLEVTSCIGSDHEVFLLCIHSSNLVIISSVTSVPTFVIDSHYSRCSYFPTSSVSAGNATDSCSVDFDRLVYQ